MSTQGSISLLNSAAAPFSVQATQLPSGIWVPNNVIVDPGGVNLASVDAFGNIYTQNGGSNSKLNQTAAAVIKASPGRLRKIIIVAPGTTSGAFTFNDCTTTGAAAAANEIFTMLYNATANVAGLVISLDWPCLVGIVCSAVPGGGSPIYAVSYD